MWPVDKLFPRKRLPDRLPFDLMVDDRTLFTKAGGFLQVAHCVGPSLNAFAPATVDTYYDQLGALEGGLGDGWTILHDQWRWLLDASLPKRDFGGNRAAQMVDSSERRQFAGDRAFDNSLFISAHYEPDSARAGLMEWLSEDDKAFSRFAARQRFNEDVGKFFGSLRLIMPRVTMLEGDALWSYLSQTVNYEPWRATMPAISVGLSEALGSTRWRTRRARGEPRSHQGLRINDNHIRTVELFSMGALTADTARFLHQLPSECRWVVRIDTTAKHQQAKWLKRMRAEYDQRRQSIPRRILQHLTRREEADTNPAAAHQMAETDQLRVDVELGDQGFAPITMNVHVWHPDAEVAEQRALDVELGLKDKGFRAERATINAVFAVLADIPGSDPQAREVPAVSAQITRVSPVTGVSRGEVMDGKWDGPALMLGYSEDGIPVRFAWHGPGQDNGNTSIIGRSGGGKSTLAALMMSKTLKYTDSRVIVFDIGRAFLPTCLSHEGDYFELGQGTPCVQPLRHVDQPDQFILLHDWLCRALAYQGVQRTHDTDQALTSAMRLVARLPIAQRTMTALVERVGASSDVREALRHFTRAGPYQETFDGVVESYGSARVVGIECGAIRKSEILPLIVSAVFDAIRYERLRDGHPSVVMFDEFHELLKREAFRDEIDRIGREIRKHNGVMVLATQNPADMTEDLAAVIDAQCPNRILTPNPEVLEPNQMRFYRALGCSDAELRELAVGYEKADYFFRTSQFRGRLRLRLTDEAAAICGRTEPRDIQQCFQIRAEIANKAEFLPRWLEYTGAQNAEEKAA